MSNFDLRKYLAEGKLLKETIMVDTAIMVDPNNALMSNASDEEIDYIKANLTNVSKMPVDDFQEKYDVFLSWNCCLFFLRQAQKTTFFKNCLRIVLFLS